MSENLTKPDLFRNPYDCDKCEMFGTLCALHRKIEANKGVTAIFDETCRYCQKRGEPCSRHGGIPSYEKPVGPPRGINKKPVEITSNENTNGPVERLQITEPIKLPKPANIKKDDLKPMPEAQIKTIGPVVIDPELKAISVILEALKPFDNNVQQRIFNYIKERKRI